MGPTKLASGSPLPLGTVCSNKQPELNLKVVEQEERNVVFGADVWRVCESPLSAETIQQCIEGKLRAGIGKTQHYLKLFFCDLIL